jgi:hypothetical protein
VLRSKRIERLLTVEEDLECRGCTQGDKVDRGGGGMKAVSSEQQTTFQGQGTRARRVRRLSALLTENSILSFDPAQSTFPACRHT